MDLAAAIGDLRSVKGNDMTSEMTVNMPGGKSVLGQSGVQIKVCQTQFSLVLQIVDTADIKSTSSVAPRDYY